MSRRITNPLPAFLVSGCVRCALPYQNLLGAKPDGY